MACDGIKEILPPRNTPGVAVGVVFKGSKEGLLADCQPDFVQELNPRR